MIRKFKCSFHPFTFYNKEGWWLYERKRNNILKVHHIITVSINFTFSNNTNCINHQDITKKTLP